MERVLGIGGVFFKARGPQALAAWYGRNLGVPVVDGEQYALLSAAEGDQTVWSVFPEDTTYFDPGRRPFMLNFRVRDLEAMFERLRAAGATVDDRIDGRAFGRFGWFTDPEGNRVELWESGA